MLTIACSLMSGYGQGHESACLRLEVDFGSVLESEVGQEWRFYALKACIG